MFKKLILLPKIILNEIGVSQLIKLLTLSLCVLISTFTLLQVINKSDTQSQLDSHYVYIYDPIDEDSSLLSKYHYSNTIAIDETNNTNITNPYPSDFHVKLSDLHFFKETSAQLIDFVSKKINSHDDIMNYNILYNYNSQMISEFNPPNRTYGVDKIIVGSYPKTNNEVLIPESIAISIGNKEHINNYNDILGKTINISNTAPKSSSQFIDAEYTISGIYQGENNFIINPPLVDSSKSINKDNIIIQFNTLFQKEKFLRQNPSIYTLSRTQIFSLSSKIKIIAFFILCFLSLILIYKNISYIYKRLYFYKMYYKIVYMIILYLLYIFIIGFLLFIL